MNSDRSRAKSATHRQRFHGRDISVTVQGAQHTFDHASVNSANHWMLNGHIAKWAVIIYDLQLVIALLGVRCESVGGEGIGYGLHR